MKTFTFSILTPVEQYYNLQSKGLYLDQNKETIIHFLTHHSYFKLMLYFSPYRRIVPDGSRKFIEHVTWSQILQAYYFDHELRILLFSNITYIENSFKNNFCQISCQKLGTTWREDKKNFNDPVAQKEGKLPQVFQESIQPILSEIDTGKSKYEQVQKYIEKYDTPRNPPFRNMLEVLTFGQVVKMYRYIADKDIIKNVAHIYGMHPKKLHSRMKTLVDTRNICCHHNKLFDKTSWKIAEVNKIKHMIPEGRDTTYHVCVIIHYLLQHIHVNTTFTEDLHHLLLRYPSVTAGFPQTWLELREEKGLQGRV